MQAQRSETPGHERARFHRSRGEHVAGKTQNDAGRLHWGNAL